MGLYSYSLQNSVWSNFTTQDKTFIIYATPILEFSILFNY